MNQDKDRQTMTKTSAAITAAVMVFMGLPASVFGQVGTNNALLNPNLASEGELLGVPHLDAEAVESILEGRPFLDITDLHVVLAEHVDAEALIDVYGHLWVPLNLNATDEDAVRLIPGVGNRMVHEFEEYRPYIALAQFRREIGKYVDDAELARLEQYVFVPIDLNSASAEAILTIPGMGPRMLHEFEEYRPYVSLAQFRREIGKYVDDDELARLERYVVVN